MSARTRLLQLVYSLRCANTPISSTFLSQARRPNLSSLKITPSIRSYHQTRLQYAPTSSKSQRTLQNIAKFEQGELIYESKLASETVPRFAWAASALFGLGLAMVGLLTFREDIADVRKRHSLHEQSQDESIMDRRRTAGLDTTPFQRFMLGAIPTSLVGILLLILKRGGDRLISRVYLLPRNRIRIECSRPFSSRATAKKLSQVHAIDAVIPGSSVTADVSQMFQPWQVLVDPSDPKSVLKTYYLPAGNESTKHLLDTGKVAIMTGISIGNTARPDARSGVVTISEIDTRDSHNLAAFRLPAHKD